MYRFSKLYLLYCLLERKKGGGGANILFNLDGSKMTELSFAPKPEEQANSLVMVKASCLRGDQSCLSLLNIIKRDGKET